MAPFRYIPLAVTQALVQVSAPVLVEVEVEVEVVTLTI
jgi:hypothetical protein